MAYVNMFDPQYKAEHLTPKSEANLALEANRPSGTMFAEGQTNYNKGSLWQRGGGRFFDRGDMARLRRHSDILNSHVKRGLRKARPLNDGDAFR